MELPPRARRIRDPLRMFANSKGTTSACAENTALFRMLLSKTCELPPRARRIPFSKDSLPRGKGTTSACAENTRNVALFDHPRWNYLRVRGEYAKGDLYYLTGLELPPRARRIQGGSPGTTSACAENTPKEWGIRAPHGNYLRVRGEYDLVVRNDHAAPELPPRARRIHWLTLNPTGLKGTTSACAENTAQTLGFLNLHRNYLRVRGEYSGTHRRHPKPRELPPRARRIQFNSGRDLINAGTTSACAENTVPRSSQHPN